MQIVNYPKISIVTPNFNGAKFLEETIKSVLDQGYPNLEYIIIDAGSTDDSVEIIKKYEKQLKYWHSLKDNGIYDGIQKGFELSTGEIMGWINSDDKLHNKSLFVIAELFSLDNNIKWITGLPCTINELSQVIDVYDIRKWSKLNYVRKDYNVIQQESTFWKRDLWNQAGGTLNLNYKFAGDLELWARFFAYEKLFSVSTILGSFRSHSIQQISQHHKNNYLEEANKILSEMQVTAAEHKKLKKLNFLSKHKWLLKHTYFKEKYDLLFDYPPLIKYNFERHAFNKL